MSRGKVLIVDLNNYARYPTLAIGYLVAPLRRAGFEVELLSPLAHGQRGVMREHQESAIDHLKRRVYMAPPAPLWHHQDWLYDQYAAWRLRLTKAERALLETRIERSEAQVILLSAYLTHRTRVQFIADLAARRRVPVLLGGPVFNVPGIAEDWAQIPGISSVFGGEGDFVIVDLVDALMHGRPVHDRPGVSVNGAAATTHFTKAAEPLAQLDALPVPDFSDFPWARYPHRIVPLMATRGCAWGNCTFCSDVITASGRGFRSRPVEHVLHEVEEQSKRCAARDFIFLDIKLNSDVALWRGIIGRIQQHVPGARWIGTVHVDTTGDNGLDRDTLMRAHASGMARLSFGLESGSQQVLRRMAKGCKVERNETFLRDASSAGISVRATMIVGYPGEAATDVDLSTRFLERNIEHLDRINLCRFKPMPGTRFEELYKRRPERFDDIRILKWNRNSLRANYEPGQMRDYRYRRAVVGLLNAVYAINRRPLRNNLTQFDGLM
ncbi:MAG: B12-binding domain-containing radical SAM protein [Steroidobacteraceae bacterium]